MLTLSFNFAVVPTYAEAKAMDYQNYSYGAYSQLEKAETVNLIHDRIRNNMKANITREEFA